MARNEVDTIDLVAMPLFMVGSFISLGLVGGLSIAGFNPAEPLITLPGETVISAAHVMALAALVVVIYTNKPDLDLHGGVQAWIILATAFLVIAPPFIPLLESLISTDIAAIIVFLIQTSGYTAASYLG